MRCSDALMLLNTLCCSILDKGWLSVHLRTFIQNALMMMTTMATTNIMPFFPSLNLHLAHEVDSSATHNDNNVPEKLKRTCMNCFPPQMPSKLSKTLSLPRSFFFFFGPCEAKGHSWMSPEVGYRTYTRFFGPLREWIMAIQSQSQLKPVKVSAGFVYTLWELCEVGGEETI